MSKSKPQMNPQMSGSVLSPNPVSQPSMPTSSPPTKGASAKGGCGCGGGTVTASRATIALPTATATIPTLTPMQAVGAAVATWENNKRVVGLFCVDQPRSAWVYVDGIGWKQLAGDFDSANTSLNVLGTHAREKDSAVYYREETDGKIHEMYVY